jgi:hypothetical protein
VVVLPGFRWRVGRIASERVDPGGVISSAIEARQVVGSIVYFSTEITEPGVIQHIEGNRISLGEPDGTRSDRSAELPRRSSPRDFAVRSPLASGTRFG